MSHRQHFITADANQGRKIIVPTAEECPDHDHGRNGFAHGQDNPPQSVQRITTVDHGGIE